MKVELFIGALNGPHKRFGTSKGPPEAEKELACSMNTVHTYITYVRIELESPSWSGFEENSTDLLQNLTTMDFLAQFV